MRSKVKNFFIGHYLAIILSLVVGFISVAPYFLSKAHIGGDYRGMYFFSTANEDVYLSRIQEIIDGHGWAGSPFLYEYKNFKPVMPPIGEYFYALPAILLDQPGVRIVIASKFLFPALVFTLIYCLIYSLSDGKEKFSTKLNAATGGLFAVLGYDLIDYTTAFNFFTGKIGSTSLLLWTRPVNPITGALLLFIFLNLVWKMINGKSRFLFIPGGIILSLMAGYFFSWGIAVSSLAMLILIFLLKKDRPVAKNLALTAVSHVFSFLPYWLLILRPLNNSSEEIYSKNGMFFTHAPIINKVWLAISLIIFFALLAEYVKKNSLRFGKTHYFLIGIIGGGWLAYNQQVFTGRTIWPYHFVQYSIPLAIIIGQVLLANYLKPKFFKAWASVTAVIIITVFSFNALALKSYAVHYENFRESQKYAGVVSWLNSNAPRDCVVLVKESGEGLNPMVTALTQCNSFLTSWVFSGLPEERIDFNFFAKLRLKGVKPEAAKNFMLKNKDEVRSLFYNDWDQYFSRSGDEWLIGEIERLSRGYADFYKKDFSGEIKKFKLDYVVIEEGSKEETINLLPSLNFIGEFNGYALYEA